MQPSTSSRPTPSVSPGSAQPRPLGDYLYPAATIAVALLLLFTAAF